MSLDIQTTQALRNKNYPLADILLNMTKSVARARYIDPSFAFRQIKHQIKDLEQKFPQIAWWRTIIEQDLRADPGRCVGFALKLDKSLGELTFSEVAVSTWEFLDENARRNICYTSHHPWVLSDNTVLTLFYHSSSNTKDRHMLGAGLAATFLKRATITDSELKTILSDIGEHPETHRQRVLERFLENVGKNF